jgi:hypothetical protein
LFWVESRLVARAPRHHIRVEVDRVDRVGDGDADVLGEDLLDVAAIALGPVGDEDLVRVDLAAARLVVVPGDGFTEKCVPLVRAVPLEGLTVRHLVRGGMQGGDTDGGERFRDVADAEPDDCARGVGLLAGGDTAGDVGEKVGRLQLGVVFVDADHCG